MPGRGGADSWEVVADFFDFSALVGSLSAFCFAFGTFLLSRVGSSRRAILVFRCRHMNFDDTKLKSDSSSVGCSNLAVHVPSFRASRGLPLPKIEMEDEETASSTTEKSRKSNREKDQNALMEKSHPLRESVSQD